MMITCEGHPNPHRGKAVLHGKESAIWYTVPYSLQRAL